MPAKIASIEEFTARFWGKASIGGPDSCWLWNASKTKGYGRVRRNGRSIHAPRVAYELTYGQIAGDLTVDHSCNRPDCVNPRYLRLLSRSANSSCSPINTARRAKTHCPSGHRYAGANLLVDKRGRRYCRRCQTERKRIARAR